MNKEIEKTMREEGFFLLRSKNHAVWKHTENGYLVTTSKTPRSEQSALYEIRKNIRRQKGEV